MILNASIAELKKEINFQSKDELSELLIQLIKYKKENKELLDYLLFHKTQQQKFIESIKEELNSLFEGVHSKSHFFAKKTVRKIIKVNSKYINFSKDAIVCIETSAHICRKMNQMIINYAESPVMLNMYLAQLKKIEKYIKTLHEDLQYDYQSTVDELMQACRD